jgi:putative inorganic carbon (HCO3(-)) transporter
MNFPSPPLLSAGQVTTVLPNLDRIIRGLLYIYIFSLPFHRLLFIERNGFIILLVLLAIWCLVNRRHFFLRTPVDVPFSVLVGWVGVSLLSAASPGYSLQELGKLLQQGLIFYMVLYFFRENEDRARILWLLLMSQAAISLYGVWQFEVKPWFGPDDPRGRAYLLIPSFLSAEVWLTTYLITMIPLSAALAIYASMRWQRVAAAFVTTLGIACLVLTFSRAGVLALVVEAVIFASLIKRKIVTLLVAGGTAAVVLSGAVLTVVQHTDGITFVPGETKFTTYNLEARLKVWKLGVEKMWEHPLLGVGYGKETFYYLTKEDPSRLAANKEPVPMPTGLHNTVLDMAVGAGIPAGIAYVWLMWTIWRSGFERFRTENNHLIRMWSLALVLLVAGLFVRNWFDHMWIGTMALLFWVMVGLSLEPVVSQPRETRPSRIG